MLSRRLASAAVIVSVLIGMIGIDYFSGQPDSLGRPGLILALIAISVALLSAGELASLFRQRQPELSIRNAVIVSGLAVGICCLPVFWPPFLSDGPIGLFGWTMMALTFACGTTVVIEIFDYRGDGEATDRIARTILVHTWNILLFGFFVAHRLLPGENALGLVALTTLIATAKMSDSAAYFTGKLIGTTKLASRLSPGKTVQGALGGIAGAWIGVAVVVYLVAPRVMNNVLEFPVWWVFGYGLAIALAGIVGDLSVSLFKRDVELKDSGSYFPGLGGILDITDSLVFAAPVSYFCWMLIA